MNKRVYAVVSYNARDDTLASIRSLRSLEGLSGIIVVDNASPDGIAEELNRYRAVARRSGSTLMTAQDARKQRA